jgi:hypothetical protein
MAKLVLTTCLFDPVAANECCVRNMEATGVLDEVVGDYDRPIDHHVIVRPSEDPVLRAEIAAEIRSWRATHPRHWET